MYKLNYKTKAEVPAELLEFAKEIKNGEETSYEVNLAPAQKVNEFRDRNIELAKKNEDLTVAFAVFKPLLGEDKKPEELVAEITELHALKQQVADGKIKGAENIEAEILTRTEAMRRAHDETTQRQAAEIAALKDNVSKSDSRFKNSVVENAIMAAAGDSDLGVNPKAMSHILNAGRAVFSAEEIDGQLKLIAKDRGGNTMFGEDGASTMSVSEWMKSLKDSDPFFFLASNGGGAAGGKQIKGGMSEADFQKLSPKDKLVYANRNK